MSARLLAYFYSRLDELNKAINTYAIVVAASFPNNKTIDHQCRHIKEYFITIIILNGHRAMIDTSYVVESQVHINLHSSIHLKSSANEVD